MGKPPLFLVFEDDNYVHVYLSPEEAAIQIEALDVEETARRMFDAEGRPYRVEWLRPNRTGKWLGLRRWAENGRYSFVPSGPVDTAGLLEMLSHASGVLSNRQSEVAEVKALELRLTGIM
jgi:hypothetical protein